LYLQGGTKAQRQQSNARQDSSVGRNLHALLLQIGIAAINR
jgi:hypothetical protein